MNEQRYRHGEWNEALCFWTDERPRTEIAAQFCRDHWNIFYISSRVIHTIQSGITDQKEAEDLARDIAWDVLTSSNPIKRAERWKGKS
jgi:hypothetical protein